MTHNHKKVSVETSYSPEIKNLTLTLKDAQPQDNTFYLQVLCLLGGFIRVTTRVEDGEIRTRDMSRKEFHLLQDGIRETIDATSKTKTISFGDAKMILLRSEGNPLGCAIGNNKYVIDETDVERLREFCAKLM